MIGRESLRDPCLDELWRLVRHRLERRDDDRLGRLRLPALDAKARLALTSLLGRPPGATIDLARLERALADLGVGPDLATAIGALGHEVSSVPRERRAARRAARDARAAARGAVATWPEPWARDWVEEVARAGVLRGFGADDATALVGAVRRLLDHLAFAAGTPSISRVDLAAQLFGSSHALDRGSRLEAAATRALARASGPERSSAVWESAGVHLDLTSAPVLTWNLPIIGDCGLAPLVDAATAAGVPLHLTQLALRGHPVRVLPGADVLVTENPRVVEAAAQRHHPGTVVTTNGNPSGAVVLLLAQLLECRAHVRYHGDFDAAGLAICSRLHGLGLLPWRMGGDDYLAAVVAARSAGVELPVDDSPAPATPWDPALRGAFERHRAIVHEERLLDELLR